MEPTSGLKSNLCSNPEKTIVAIDWDNTIFPAGNKLSGGLFNPAFLAMLPELKKLQDQGALISIVSVSIHPKLDLMWIRTNTSSFSDFKKAINSTAPTERDQVILEAIKSHITETNQTTDNAQESTFAQFRELSELLFNETNHVEVYCGVAKPYLFASDIHNEYKQLVCTSTSTNPTEVVITPEILKEFVDHRPGGIKKPMDQITPFSAATGNDILNPRFLRSLYHDTERLVWIAKGKLFHDNAETDFSLDGLMVQNLHARFEKVAWKQKRRFESHYIHPIPESLISKINTDLHMMNFENKGVAYHSVEMDSGMIEDGLILNDLLEQNAHYLAENNKVIPNIVS